METGTQESQPNGAITNGRTNGDEPEGEESVSADAYNSVKADMHKFKDEARKNAEELKRLKDQEMRDKEQWKDYGAAKEKEANDWKTKYETLSSSIQERAKISAVREQALKLGLVDSAIEDLELMDLKDVVVETTSTGRVNIHGAKSAAERIKSIRPHWFTSNRIPNVNGGRPEVDNAGAGKITYMDLQKAEAEAKKTGDYKEYTRMTQEFKKQK